MTKSILKFTKIRDVKSPQRGTPKSAGIDFFVPKFTATFIDALVAKNPQINDVRFNEYEYITERDHIILAPHAQLVIPSGIKIIVVYTNLNFLNISIVFSYKLYKQPQCSFLYMTIFVIPR